MTPQAVRRHVAGRFAPQGAMLAAAGNIDWSAFCDLAERHFGGWSAAPPPEVQVGDAAGGVTHLRKESAQAHIGLAHAAPTVTDARYYPARLAAAVLSEGAGSRLFTEVREKRGLVYHVGARYHALKDHAGLFTYAGTVPQKAQRTFEVLVGELRRLGEGIEPDEMTRARTQLKSALVMQGESTAARAAALVHDWHHLRRLRSLQEICDAVDKVTVDDCVACLRDFPAANFTVLVIGPESIDAGAVNG
jgi:predicted Zn-dependent peptidase